MDAQERQPREDEMAAWRRGEREELAQALLKMFRTVHSVKYPYLQVKHTKNRANFLQFTY
jgi:hypothetical protein